MSFSGLLLALFLVTHVAANLIVLVSPAKFNDYSHTLTSNLLLLYTAEAGLIILTLLHIWMAIKLTQINRAARPERYRVQQDTGRSRRWWASRRMGITGSFILAFVLFHLWHFKFGTSYSAYQGGTEVRDLARLVIEDFKKPVYVVIYVIAMIIIGAHLRHGFQSVFNTLGLDTTRTERCILQLSRLYVIAVFGGFILIPLWIYFVGVGA